MEDNFKERETTFDGKIKKRFCTQCGYELVIVERGYDEDTGEKKYDYAHCPRECGSCCQ